MGKKKYAMWSIGRIAKMIKASQKQKFDFNIIVTGRRGLGKSTFAVKLAYRLGSFNPNTDLVFSRDDVIRQLSIKKRGVIIADEMINVTFNRDFWSEDQKTLIKMLNMYRDRGNILICCVPNFATLDKQFLGLTKMRVDVVRRGMAILHKPHQSSYLTDQWDTKLNESIERKWLARGVFKPKYERLSTFKGFIRFQDITQQQRNLYEKLKQQKRYELHQEEEEIDPNSKRGKYQRLYEQLKSGNLDKDKFMLACNLMGFKYLTAMATLNNYLKNDGIDSTCKAILNKKKIILKSEVKNSSQDELKPRII